MSSILCSSLSEGQTPNISFAPMLYSRALSSDALPPPQRDQRTPVVPGLTRDAFGGEWMQWGRAPTGSKGEDRRGCLGYRREHSPWKG